MTKMMIMMMHNTPPHSTKGSIKFKAHLVIQVVATPLPLRLEHIFAGLCDGLCLCCRCLLRAISEGIQACKGLADPLSRLLVDKPFGDARLGKDLDKIVYVTLKAIFERNEVCIRVKRQCRRPGEGPKRNHGNNPQKKARE